MKKLTIILMLALLLLPMVLAAEDFSAQATSLFTLDKCSSEKNVIILTNTGDTTNNYLLSGVGKNSDWVQYPGLFTINPKQSMNVESILTVPCSISAGNYQINTLISTTTGLEKEIAQDVVVKSTPNILVTVDSVEKTIKPCESAVFTLDITNPSSFQETYTLSVDNPDMKISETEITLEPNSSSQATLSFKPSDCSLIGEKSFLLSVETTKTKLIADLDLFVDIEDYGIPSIAEGVNKVRTYYNENVVDLDIINTGESDTNYVLSVLGTDWVSVSPRILSIPAGETETVTLNLAPTTEVRKGKYEITIIAEVEDTGVEYEKSLTVKLTTQGLIDNLFDKYLPLTVLIIITLLVFGIIVVYSIQYMSTEEYQKQKLKNLKEKEKNQKLKTKKRALKQKEKARLKQEHAKEKKRILLEREKRKAQKIKEKELKKERKAKKREAKLLLKAKKEKAKEQDREKAKLRKEKEEKQRSQKYQKELRKDYHIIARKDVLIGKKDKNIWKRLIFALILIVLLVLIVIFIQPIINNLQYVVLGIIVLGVLFILGRIRRKRKVKFKWRGLSLAKSKKVLDVNWKKGVQQIKIKLESPIQKLKAKVTRGRGRNERYVCIDEHIYQYFRVSANTEEEDVSDTEVIFKVPIKWLKRKSIDDDEVVLYQLDNGEWKELETEKTGWDEKYVYYKGYSEKLGVFAIIGTETAEEIEEDDSPSKKGKGLFALIGIIVIALLIFLLLKPASIQPSTGIPAQSWLQGEQHSLRLNQYFTDPDGDLLEFGLLEEVENIDIWFKDGIAYITPDADFTGERSVIITASDTKGGYAESNPVKLIVKNKTLNYLSQIIKFALGIIILLAFIGVVVKLIGMIKNSMSE